MLGNSIIYSLLLIHLLTHLLTHSYLLTHLLTHSFSSADFGRIMKQFSVRKSKSLKQAIAFPFPDTNQFISGYSTDICTATTPYHRAIGSIPSMAQLYVNKALHDGTYLLLTHSYSLTHSLTHSLTYSLTHSLMVDIFNIFVINLWSNFIRRNYMTQQFSRSDMRPVYYAPGRVNSLLFTHSLLLTHALGVDAMFMAVNITKNIVNNETIIIQTHLAAAIAHYQIWKEVCTYSLTGLLNHSLAYSLTGLLTHSLSLTHLLTPSLTHTHSHSLTLTHSLILTQIVENDLAFGIIFEDDVDLDTDVAKCVIKEAISQLIRDPEIADNWSILYLDYSSEHNFSEEAIEVQPTHSFTHLLTHLLTHSPTHSLTHLLTH